MNYADPEETMNGLVGHKIIDWGCEDTMYHFILDDGRILVFMALGIVLDKTDAVH